MTWFHSVGRFLRRNYPRATGKQSIGTRVPLHGYHFNGSRPGRAMDHDLRAELFLVRREIGRVSRGPIGAVQGANWLERLRRRESQLLVQLEAH